MSVFEPTQKLLKLWLWMATLWGFYVVGAQDIALGQQSADSQWEFAEHLFHKGEYYRAVTEYERFAFYFPQDPRSNLAKVRTLESFLGGKWWREVVAEAQNLLKDDSIPLPLQCRVRELMAGGLIRLGRHEEARGVINTALDMCEDKALRERLGTLILEVGVAAEKQSGGGSFETRETSHPQTVRMDASVAPEKEGIRSREPVLAGFLASVLPGLGHLYLGRWEDAVLVFAVNGAFIAATLEAIREREPFLAGGIAAAELLWYSGNIFSAVSSAHKYNRSVREKEME